MSGASQPDSIWVHAHGRYRRVNPGDLDWIEAERDYVRLHTPDGSFLHHETMASIEARIGTAAFRRVHRSAIVRWDRASEVRRGADGALTVVTGGGVEVRVGRSYAAALLAELASRAPFAA
ncbi:LytTR family DNA-binding domain-containing protein [Sphingomonas sp. AOB5]|uniref:LytR/AlgR family response regulator transcription factor n=1 Tax=Sphingomonas sp. AOB5 TaxID=3034017 RepID=UPI0023F71ABF|nr:LytTR family DNA-binding domain-containing protein [Sphingomonas sp. AOB5]MDF7774402.1 LytTR family DNA-binding domain-containing protein [Sphingomonas sp. AOB5]